jgi:sugar (pentulose or hexulose) kinase
VTGVLLGLDIGTTAVKAAVFEAGGGPHPSGGRGAGPEGPVGAELAGASAPMPWRAVPTGAELAPGDLLRAVLDASARALEAVDGEVLAVGVAGMAETGLLLDRHGEPVVPLIAWHDSRGTAESRRLEQGLGRERFAERTGLTTRPLSTIVKYAWMRAHWPAAARGVRWLNVPEWIVRRLGGEEGAESSLASRTGFYDLHERAPWDEALAWAGAPAELMPAQADAGTPLGRGDGTLAAARGAALAVGGHDHQAAAVGAGAAGEGDVLDSCGTAEAWIRATAPLPPARVREAVAAGITVGWHAAPGRHVLIGSVRSGAVLQAVLDLLGVTDRAPLEQAAPGAEPGALRLEGFTDEGLTISGVERGASPAALYRAALEALGAAGAELLATMDALAGPRTRLVVTGGWAEGEAARAVKERHLGPFEHSPGVATGARGAAVAAARAAGLSLG